MNNTIRSQDHQITRSQDHQITRSQDHQITRSQDHKITTSQDIPDSDELTREIVKSLQAKTESEYKIYMENKAERDKIISLLQSTCRHAYVWINDPYYQSLHECRKCGKMEAVGFGNIY